jgi:hypothetical protein
MKVNKINHMNECHQHDVNSKNKMNKQTKNTMQYDSTHLRLKIRLKFPECARSFLI